MSDLEHDRIDTSINPQWDSIPENGDASLDPLAILIAAEDDEDDDDYNTIEDNTMTDTTSNPFADANDKDSYDAASATLTLDQQIEAGEAEVKQIEEDLLKVRGNGKEQFVISKSVNAGYRERKAAEVKVVELQLDMKNLITLLSASNEKLRQLHISKMLLNVQKLEIPTDETPIGERAAATFLTGGINGVRTSLHYLDNRKPKLEELCERDRKRGNVAGKVYRDYQEDLDDLNALVEQLQIIIEWAMPTTLEALASMETNEYFNPSLRDPTERFGTKTDNATPFD